jgi:uncharacterized membrane protein
MGAGQARTYGTERLNALSDGVFAIVLTLLVLDLGLPEPPHPGHSLAHELGENIPDFLGWLVSFVVIARVWVVHHAITASMKRAHTGTLVLNFVLLGLISLTPFSSSLIGAYEFHEGLATAVFSFQLGLVCLVVGLLARHVHTEPRVRADDADDLSWHWRHHVRVVPVVAAGAVAISFVEPYLAIALWGLEFVLLAGVRLSRA